MAIVIDNIKFYYDSVQILDRVSFSVNSGDKLGLVGDNGCGKTTLLNIICGELEPEEGSVSIPRNMTIGYIKQGMSLTPGNTVLEEMETVLDAHNILRRLKRLEAELSRDPSLSREYDAACAEYQAIDGYNLGYRIRQTLAGLGFGAEYYDRPVDVLSGGEKTKLAMAKLLVSQPDLLVLDEPTNHLDISASEWLKEFLCSFGKAVLIVSHDGSFLDAVCNKIVELEHRKSRVYSGNYSAYRLQKQEQTALEEKRWRETSEKAAKLSDYVDRNLVRASTSNMAKSRRKQLEKLDLTPPETHLHERIVFRFPETPQPYKELFKTKGLSVGIKGKKLFDCDDMLLLRGNHLAIMGGNGTGKTTLLRTILKQLPPLSGSSVIGAGAKISYYEQNVFKSEARDAMTVVRDRYPRMTTTEIRTLLAGVGLRGDEVFISVDRLSGGERARLMICLMSLEKPNVILLDEPTNHLDAYSRQILTDAMCSFGGTIITVSHDIEFITALNASVLFIEKGRASFYENLSAWKKRGSNLQTDSDSGKSSKPSLGQKEERREKARLRQQKSDTESQMSRLETEIKEAEDELNSPATASNASRLTELCTLLDSLKTQLSVLEEQWLEVDMQLSEYE